MKLENELAEELGLERKIISRMRKNGEIEATKVGNRVAYSEEQEHKLRNLIQKEMMVQELGDPQPAKTEQELVITQIPRNPRLVVCNEIYVRVRSNENFLRGMKVKARPPLEDNGVWVMIGRCPRWRGKY